MRTAQLPRDLLEQIERLLNSRAPDDLGVADFNSVDILNGLFPDEASLSAMDSVHGRFKQDHDSLQQEIYELKEKLEAEQDESRMQIIQALIAELLAQMTRIREKATESEAIVRELTKDIQALDLAKRNLLLSLTNLKRYQILVEDLGRLESLIGVRSYREISSVLSAVKAIAISFKPFVSVDKIAMAWRRQQELNGRLRNCLDEDFEAFFLQDKSRPLKNSTIRDACLVVDVMGDDVRLQVIDRYCSFELKEYRRIFRSTDEAGQLDNISRRFAWFKRVLSQHEEERASIFPSKWKVAHYLCAKFVDITRDDLVAALSHAGSKLTVTLLLESLQQTLDFEASMSRKFDVPFLDIVKVASTITRQPSLLSSTFDAHMGVFVDAQDKALADMLALYRGSRSRTSLDETTNDSSNASVLPSSTDLFYFYRQTLEQCAKLSNKGPLLDLCALQKKWLRIYAEDVLMSTLKRGEKERKSNERRSFEGKANVLEIKAACVVLNTAEYCHATALQLEERIKDIISDEYRDKVTLQPECDIFVSVIASAITFQLRELETACDASFATLARSSWNDVQDVSGPSPAATELVRAVASVVNVLRENVDHKKWLRNFYDKAANMLLTRFTFSLVKSRPIPEPCAEQILIDLQVLRGSLLELPGPQLNDGSHPTHFARNIIKTTSNLETLLKLVIAPAIPADAFVQNYTLLIGDSSFSNVQKILDLKGTPRAEQNSLLDTFLTVTSTKENLETTSFLSSLDMNPDSKTAATTIRPLTASNAGGSRVSLPSLVTEDGAPGLGISTAAGADRRPDVRREVFPDLRRFMTFGGRKETVSKGS